MNPKTPIIVGVGQMIQRVADPLAGKEPVDMMVEAVRMAAEDTAAARVLQAVDSVRVIRGMWRYRHPAGYVAEQIGVPGAELVGTCFGGNMVQSIVNKSALDILNGERELIVITSAENGNSQAKARKLGIELPLKETVGPYNYKFGDDRLMSSEAEIARGVRAAIQVYPVFENALRHHLGESIEAHVGRISALWATFSDVARDNPHAWIRQPVEPKAIRNASSSNRMIGFPYPKLMNANSAVDMAAALILCSVEKARMLGIPESRWVYPWSGTDAGDHFFVSARDNLYSSPAIRIAGRRALELAGLSIDDLDFVDLYSCFPSAVQVAARELDLEGRTPLTVTGGLTFGGGPLNSYVMHSIARMIELLRLEPGEKGMITANGGFLTKHAFGVYSGHAPARDFTHCDLQAEVDALPSRDWVVNHEGEVVVESYTVMYDDDEPAVGHAACLLPDGRRTWANTADRDVVVSMTREEFCGRRARIDGRGGLTVH